MRDIGWYLRAGVAFGMLVQQFGCAVCRSAGGCLWGTIGLCGDADRRNVGRHSCGAEYFAGFGCLALADRAAGCVSSIVLVGFVQTVLKGALSELCSGLRAPFLIAMRYWKNPHWFPFLQRGLLGL